MKKNILKTLALSGATVLMFTACNKSNEPAESPSDAKAKGAPTSMKIAYVEVDSIMSQYKFCKDYSLILQKKGRTSKTPSPRSSRPCKRQPPTSSKRCSRMPTPASRQR